MNSPDVEPERPFLTPRKIALQVIGWLAGIALLAWVIHGAVQQGGGDGAPGAPGEGGGWQRIRDADPWLIAALLGCTLASAIFNGTAFWITIQPIRRVRWWDMQVLNLVANMLNYAPVRLGALLRVVYHLRVDRLTLLQIGAWFALIAYLLLLGIGACLLATLLHERIDLVWLAIVIGVMVAGAGAARFFAGNRLVARYGRGVDQVVCFSPGLWGAVVLRLLDLAAFAGRMWAAVAILGLAMSPADTIVLAMVALAADLVPFGKLGFREFCVAAAAARLSMQSADIDAAFKQLALIDSAGQALVYLPLGALAMLAMRGRWRQARLVRATPQAATK